MAGQGREQRGGADAGPLAGASAQPLGSASPLSERMRDSERRRPVLRRTPASGGGRERGRSPLPWVISILGSSG